MNSCFPFLRDWVCSRYLFKCFTGHSLALLLNSKISAGSVWDGGLVVLCFCENTRTHLFLVKSFYIFYLVKVCRAWPLCPVTNAKSMHVLRVRSFNYWICASSNRSRYFSTISTFHVSSYLGRADLSSETPLINLHGVFCLVLPVGTGAAELLVAQGPVQTPSTGLRHPSFNPCRI